VPVDRDHFNNINARLQIDGFIKIAGLIDYHLLAVYFQS
jgi:hypothetical protein